ncbi:MAG TPA: hypothetical protein VNI02_14095 [Blastocatellia bacterium]|jgi:hypothetical protein|nr:hypothetical protein [Blastocatellia bacterium]
MNQELSLKTLREIDSLLKQGTLPVHNEHLNHLSADEDMLHYLISLKNEGLISGDIVTIGSDRVKPHRMTNIRLTYKGIKMLMASPAAANKKDERTRSVKI